MYLSNWSVVRVKIIVFSELKFLKWDGYSVVKSSCCFGITAEYLLGWNAFPPAFLSVMNKDRQIEHNESSQYCHSSLFEQLS